MEAKQLHIAAEMISTNNVYEGWTATKRHSARICDKADLAFSGNYMLKPETRDLDEWIEGVFQKDRCGARSQRSKHTSAHHYGRPGMDSVEETFQREAEAGGLVAMAYADNVAARLPHELVQRLDDALTMQQRAAVEQGINASLVAPSVEALVDGAA